MKHILLIIFLGGWAQLVWASESVDYRVTVLNQVAEKILDVYQSNHVHPEIEIVDADLVIGKGKVLVAKYVNYTNKAPKIFFSKEAYNVCQEFGADSLDALSVFLGHELGHYYSYNSNQTRFKDQFIQDIKFGFCQNRQFEAEADIFAGFAGHLAGYKTIEMSKDVLRKMYHYFELSAESTTKYVSLENRIAIADSVQVTLEDYLSVFDAGMVLVANSDYVEAKYCFDFLRLPNVFPTPVMHNNYGAVLLVEGLSYEKVSYPVLFDDDSRLRAVDRSSFSGISEEERNSEFFLKAKLAFEEAIRLDSTYWVSQFNLACVEAELGNIQEANNLLKNLSQPENPASMAMLSANVIILEGILRTKDNLIKEKTEEFFKEGLGIDPKSLFEETSGTLKSDLIEEKRDVSSVIVGDRSYADYEAGCSNQHGLFSDGNWTFKKCVFKDVEVVQVEVVEKAEGYKQILFFTPKSGNSLGIEEGMTIDHIEDILDETPQELNSSGIEIYAFPLNRVTVIFYNNKLSRIVLG